jgi:hydroxymethylpyrimidine/phosphomethylpyrimidine kinase
MIAKRLKAMQKSQSLEGANRYIKWIDNYIAEDYTEAVKKGCGMFL